MAYYSVGILICLCPYLICWNAVASDGNDAENGYKGKYSREPAHYEIIVPHKVTESGQFISHMIPHHYKRSYYKNREQKDMGSEDAVHYVVPIAGERHHIQLFPNNDVVSQGAVVEVHDGKGISEREMRKLGNIQCHYIGSVKGQENSRAALSTCYGLSGYLRTKNGYYIIEPVENFNPLSGQEHPHLLYRHETDPPQNILNCYTSGNIATILSQRAISTDNKGNSPPKNISELYIETMLVIDKTMLDYHNAIDVENYVLTVFNMAHALYHDTTLKTNINLAIVRIIRLEEEETELNLAVNKNAKKTLEFFQNWQNRMNPDDDTHPNHHDVAVLLTRIDICADDDNCGLLGASVLGGICDPKNQAALCEDNGLRLGFVIAHEIAHTLAIPHDVPEESGCNATLPNGLSTVMNPSVNIRVAEWSVCSAKFLKLFLEQGFAKCLYDSPTNHNFELPDVLPGVMYNGDFQCKELLVPTASLCDVGIGKCVEIGERLGGIDGGWSDWSSWGECSRTCGGGVASRQRHCNNPTPSHGGKYCGGGQMQHKLCNIEPCVAGTPSFRNVQCAEFNQWVYPEDNKVHEWTAYHMTDENPCILFCVNDLGDVASLRPRVQDGTKCLRGLRDICIDGVCTAIPCDSDLESNAVEDWCGVCRGDGTSCDLITGTKRIAKDLDIVKLIDIPKGSVNIKVEETQPSDAIIQVRNSIKNTTLIEGDVTGIFNLSETKVWLGKIRTKQEALSIPGPTTICLSVDIIPRDNVTFKYAYGVKKISKRTPNFEWDYLDWSKCSAQCGPGNEVSIPKCKEKIAGLVDDSYCVNKTKPKGLIRPCEIAPCIPRWMIGDWQNCAKCPHGERQRLVKCVTPVGEGEGESSVVPDYRCVLPKPKEKEKCTCTSHKTRHAAENEFTDTNSQDKSTNNNNSKKECPLKNSKNITTPATPIIIDKENFKEINFTVHQDREEEEESYNLNNSKPLTLKGKQALKYINKLNKEQINNKPKI